MRIFALGFAFAAVVAAVVWVVGALAWWAGGKLGVRDELAARAGERRRRR